ncbi:recombinase family protein [Bradyrhizobium sp. 2S1]|uniref:recombinase family protein n=1 Tax=Bradyrhizobium sp. 2S1 TaxID=1404429 RepID=UPI001CD092DC|nr:recombinase family protein [Bradyrhizobium sp. 2S1]MCK7667793.1 recombinase family protein [Bradyrhizobium sp. 2S1]
MKEGTVVGKQQALDRALGPSREPPRRHQELISDATRGKFVVVLAVAMDRLSRDQEDIAGLFKHMAFGGVRVVTLSGGDVTHLNKVLDRIIDEHGLIVSGWSADWDPALRAALTRAPTRGYPV